MGCNCKKKELWYIVFNADGTENTRVKYRSTAATTALNIGGTYRRI